MKKFRGFKLGCKLAKVFKRITRPKRRNYRNSFFRPPTGCFNPLYRIRSFARLLRRGTKGLCNSNSNSNSSPGYIQLGEDGLKRSMGVPQGHLAVYVGESEGDTRRLVVPVIYFNHPLFGELLKEAERVYGFNQSGGITLPCGIAEFEIIKMRIAYWDHCRRKQQRRY